MLTEYVDCTELKRLIEDKKIKPAALKYYLRQKGIIFTASNAEEFAEQVFTIFLGAREMEEIRDMLLNSGNYEKSLVMNIKYKADTQEDIIDILVDEMNKLKTVKNDVYNIEKPVKTEEGAYIQFSYTRKLPGRNRLLQDEKRYLKMNIRKKSSDEAVIDIRQQSSIDSRNAIEFMEKVTKSDNKLNLGHINLELLTTKNKVEFFDRIAAYSFKIWQLKTITGITVKRGKIDDDEDEDEEMLEDEENSSTLTGISQAVLNGNGLRANEFVQESLSKGYYISAMKYRYEHKMDTKEFAVLICFRKHDLRVEIDKTYMDDEGKIYVQPLLKEEQNEIIIAFQDVAYEIYYELLDEQKGE
ncbi:MAG: hypothetical protein BHW11_08760 [Clostridium sp. CAG:62_40_43]|nr:MAG: hypothetical protein BHW11_08760 [Clostridium sp. CAG:62_40_43]